MLHVLLGALLALAQPPLETQLIAQVQARLDALATGNKGPWERDLDPQVLLMDEEGNVSSKRAFLNTLAPLPKGSTGTLKVVEPRFEQIGDIAILAFVADEHEMIYHAHFQARFGIVDTYRRSGSRWMLVADEQERLPLDPPTVALDAAQMQRYVGRYRMVGGPLVFVVAIQKGALVGGRDGSPSLVLNAIADQPGAFFRKKHPGTLLFVNDGNAPARRLIDRRYYNRDLTYERN